MAPTWDLSTGPRDESSAQARKAREMVLPALAGQMKGTGVPPFRPRVKVSVLGVIGKWGGGQRTACHVWGVDARDGEGDAFGVDAHTDTGTVALVFAVDEDGG